MLDVRRLRVLREVALRGSIAGAAQSLSYSPSAVSQQMAKLEREAGLALLRRGPRSVELTEAGKRLAEHAEAILERLDEAESDLRRLAGEEAPLRLGSITTAAATILPAALASFADRRPETPVSVLEADPLVSLSRLRTRELDLAVVFEYDYVPLPTDDRLELELLLEEPMRVLLPAGHPVARQRAVRLPDLADEPWIQSTQRSSCRPFTERACRAAGFEPRIVADFDDYTVLQNAVAAGVGVGFASDLGLSSRSPGVAVKPIAFAAPQRRIFAGIRRNESTVPAIAVMLDALRDAVAARQALPAAAGAS